MIIYNDKELSSKFVKEGRLISIKAPKDLPLNDFYEKVKNGEDLSSFFIETYDIFDGETPLKFEPYENEGKTGLYSKRYSEDDVDNVRARNNTYNRPELFTAFEKYQFNQKTKYTFKKTEEPLSNDDFRKELLAGLGVLPTLWEEKDLDLITLKKYSGIGERLIRIEGNIGADNPIPDRALIEFYENNLTEQEKKMINRNIIHPRKVFDLCRLMKMYGEEKKDDVQRYNSRILPLWYLKTLEDKNYLNKDAVEEYVTPKFPNAIAKAIPMFEKAFHGHAPKVVNEYVDGQLLIRGITDESQVTDKILEDIVNHFNQKNVSKVAKYKNTTLLALDGTLSFSEFKDTLIEALAILVSPTELKTLKDKCFFTYLEAKKDLSISYLTSFIELSSKIKLFDVRKAPQDIINMALNEGGYKACKNYEQKYGYKFSDNEISIKGRHLVVQEGNKKIFILPKDDLRNFIVGDASSGGVSCCQHFNGAGESCVWKVTQDPFAGNVIIEVNGKIAAQAFVFTDEVTHTFVFDNFEYKNDGNANGYMNLIGTFVKNLPYPNVHLGMGYTEGTAWNGIGANVASSNFPAATVPKTRATNHCRGWTSEGADIYSDYHPHDKSATHGAKALKQDGAMIKFPLNEEMCHISMEPDEPTPYDILTDDRYSFMCNQFEKTIEERIAFAEELKLNPLKIIEINPDAIASFDEIPDDIQDYILENYPTKLKLIKNPNEKVLTEMVKSDPQSIVNYPNPPENLVLVALSEDGLLLKKIKEPTKKECETAVKQNGYAVKYVPEMMLNDDLLEIAVKTNPKIISEMRHPSSKLIKEAIKADKNVFYLIPEASEADKLFAVRRNPAIINSIKDASYELVKTAVELNPLLIRNFQNQYPDLRVFAIEHNPWAIRALHGLTADEARLAVNMNPDVKVAIKSPEILDELHISNAYNTVPTIVSNIPAVPADSTDYSDIDIDTI